MERNYRWRLRKSSAKEICPQCGQRRFVPYVSVADGVTMAGAEYGRCDREQSCGYFRYPGSEIVCNVTPTPQTAKSKIRFCAGAVRVDINSALFGYVSALVGYDRALAAWDKYKVGADDGRTIFWQIDKSGQIRGGKSMLYDADGHRNKTHKYATLWLHKCERWRDLCEGDELEQCFFGEHLLKINPTAKVVIVESEKTAIVMSCLSDCVWLATGGAQMIKNEQRCKALEGRDVYVLPDNGQYWCWRAVADAHGWHIFDTFERYPLFRGADILDYYEAGILKWAVAQKK